MVPESGLILPADSTGKAMRTATTTTGFTTGSGGVVHQQVITPADVNGQVQSVTPFGAAHVENPNHILFADQFNGSTLDPVQWLTGAAAPTVSNGAVTFAIGATASSAGALYSAVNLPKQFMSQFAIRADFGATQPTNNHRFIGLGTQPGTWAAATPIQDGVGFEMTTAGTFRAVIYAGGAVVQSAVLPTPTASNVYIIALKPGWHGFYIGSLENLVAELVGLSPQSELLPIRVHSINGTTAPASSPTLSIGGVAISDGGQNTIALNDGAYPWRKASVDSSGRLNAAVSGLPVSGPTAVTISTASAVYTMDVSAAGNATLWFIAGGTATSGGTYVFEQTNNGVNWAPLAVVRSDTNAVGTTFSGIIIAANASLAFDCACEGVTQIRVRNTVGGTNAITCVGAGGGMPFTPAVSIANSLATAITGFPTLTKGTQQTVGVATQDLKDSGRVVFAAWVTGGAGVTAEALFTTGFQRNGTAGTAAASVGVTAGKTLRIQNITVTMRLGANAVGWTRFVLRSNPVGTTAIGSQPLWEIEVGPGAAAAIGAVDRTSAEFPDGLEIPSGGSFGVSHISSATTNIETFSITGYEY